MKSSLKTLAIMCFVGLFLSGCRVDEFNDKKSLPVLGGTENLIEGSVSGFITDGNGEAISDALIDLNGTEVLTDFNGIFSITSSELDPNGTIIKIYADGFINGSRRFYPKSNETTAISIRLISKEAIDNFEGQVGRTIQINDASIKFPSGMYVDQSSYPYSGEIFVTAKWLDPSLPESYLEMPGDLIGLDSESNLTRLNSYGMMVVELTDELGNKINLPEGKTSELSFPIPDQFLSSAPASIPLWSFSEDLGLWIEEGSATLVNGFYIAEVSHFSFWNCGLAIDQVNISGDVVVNNNPQPTVVSIIDLTTGVSRSTFTNEDGKFNFFVPVDVELEMKVFDACGSEIETIEIGSLSSDQDLGTFNIDAQTKEVELNGLIESCSPFEFEEGWVTYFDGNRPIKSTLVYDQNLFNLDAEILCDSIAGSICVLDFSNHLMYYEIPITEESINSTMEIDLCGNFGGQIDDIPAALYYDGIEEWGYAPSLFPLIGPVTEEMIDGKLQNVIEGEVLNWMNSKVMNFRVYFEDGDDLANIEIDMLDFKAVGKCSYHVIANVRRFWGMTTEIEIINPDQVPDDISEFYFYMGVWN